MAAKKTTKAKNVPDRPLDGAPPEVSKHQRFRMERLHRSAVTNCPYNPRRTNARQRKLLQDFLTSLGLLEPLVLNKAYMLVGGHQRLAALDRIEGHGDYWLDFAVNELSPKQEREAIVGLNAPNLQGEWDLGLFKSIIDDGLDYGRVGFDAVGLEVLFDGSGVVLDMFDTKAAPAAVQSATADLLEASGRTLAPDADDATPFDGAEPDDGAPPETVDVGEYERRKARIIGEKAKLAATELGVANETDYVQTLVFRSATDRQRELEALGIDHEVRYTDARTYVAAVEERARGKD